jgi:PEGA domain-containing protein
MSVENSARQADRPSESPEIIAFHPAAKQPSSAASRSFGRLWTRSKVVEGPMADFPSERKPAVRWLGLALPFVALVVVVAAAVVLLGWWRASAAAPPSGQVVVISQPAGGEVIVDGERRGVTPLSLSLPVGPHSLLLNRDNVTRSIAVTVKAGAEATHYIDLQTQPAAEVGHLLVTTEPAGARVWVDGQARGVTPVSLADLAPGRHEVSIKSDSRTIERSVTVERGQTASLVVSLIPQSVFGWVSISSPVVMQVFEGNQKFGTTETDRIVMPAGRHTLKIVNTRLGFEVSRGVDVPAGGAATVKIEIPDGLVNLNALPWAEVWIDGRRIGETPLANVRIPVGDHEAVFRHPQLGDRRQTFVVTANEPARVALDLRK